MANLANHTGLLNRPYFETEAQAEAYLTAEGFKKIATERESRYPWNSGLVDADIRFNSYGIYIEYRA